MNLETIDAPPWLPDGRERRDPPARAARDQLSAWLKVEPVQLREVDREPAETMVVLSDAFEVAARRVLEQEQRMRDLSTRLATLEGLVRTDHLTGVANRRAVEERLEMEWSRATRHGYELAVIALDCDGLKQVNDSHGHAAGDALLREVAAHLTQVVRAGDLVGRVGGDEFTIVCPHTDHEGAALAARKMVDFIGAQVLGVPTPEPVRLAVSAGWAEARGQAGWRDLVGEADRALYEAKRLRKSSAR
ncbi:MAG: GGDEF domain-containing protein [Candidatus Dormibacteria bacterium]